MGRPVNPNDGHAGASSKDGAPMGSFKAAGANVVGSSAKEWAGSKSAKKTGNKKMGKKGY